MLANILIFLLISELSVSQLNGEFWWLSDKLRELKGVEPPLPKYEELSEFDTDESAKIIFKDDSLFTAKDKFEETNTIDDHNVNKKSESNSFQEDSIFFPDDDFRKPVDSHSKNVISNQEPHRANQETKKIKSDKKSSDVFIFKFPKDENVVINYPSQAEMPQKSARQNVNDTITKHKHKDDLMKINQTTEKPTDDHTEADHKDLFTFKFPDDKILRKYTSEPPKKEIMPPNNDTTATLIENNNEIINSPPGEPTLSKSGKKPYTENICSYLTKAECYQKHGVIYTSGR